MMQSIGNTDPAYQLHREFGDLEIQQDWLPELSSVAEVRKRLNRLVCDTQNGEKFHEWVHQTALILRRNRWNIGISYSIIGSSVTQVLGVEWLSALTERAKKETGRDLTQLRDRIKNLTFNRNDIDARLYITLPKGLKPVQATKLLYLFFKQVYGSHATGVPGIGVRIDKGNWDLFIRIAGRNHVFDSDDTEIRIPFELKGSDPILSVTHPSAFYQGSVYGHLKISDPKGLNEHAWRVGVYRSVCGKWAENDGLYGFAEHLNEKQIERQIELSLSGHAMPQGSLTRHLFLLQIVLEAPEKWKKIAHSKHKASENTLWSEALRIKDPKVIALGLQWITQLALKERWKAPFSVSHNRRMRIDVNRQTLWIEKNNFLLEEDLPCELWPLVKSIKWNDVQREGYACDPLTTNISTPLNRFFYYRTRYPHLTSLDWEMIVHQAEQFENELLRQLLEIDSSNKEVLTDLLQHAESGIFEKINLHAVSLRGANTLFDSFINKNDAQRAMILWNQFSIDKEKSWELLFICSAKVKGSLSKLASVCIETPCPDLSRWRELAAQIIPLIPQEEIRQKLLRPALHPDFPELTELYANKNPPLEECWQLLQNNPSVIFSRMLTEQTFIWRKRSVNAAIEHPQLLEPLIFDMLHWPAVEMHDSIKKVAKASSGDLRPLWKGLEANQSNDELFTLWEEWIPNVRPISREWIQAIDTLPPNQMERFLDLFERSCLKEIPLSEMITQTKIPSNPCRWIPHWIEGLSGKQKPNKRLRETCSLLEVLLAFDSPNYAKIKEPLLQLITTCMKESGSKGVLALLRAITLKFQQKPNFEILTDIFSQIETHLSKNFDPTHSASPEITFLSAVIIRLFLPENTAPSSRLSNCLEACGLDLVFSFFQGRRGGSTHRSIIDCLNAMHDNGVPKTDLWVKTVLIAAPLGAPYGHQSRLQLLNCYLDLVMDVSKWVDCMPELKEPLLKWAESATYGIDLTFQRDGTIEYLDPFYNFCLKLRKDDQISDEAVNLMRNMLSTASRWEWKEAKSALAERIKSRLNATKIGQHKVNIRPITPSQNQTNTLYNNAVTITKLGYGVLSVGAFMHNLHYFNWYTSEAMATSGSYIFVIGSGVALTGYSLVALSKIEEVVFRRLFS